MSLETVVIILCAKYLVAVPVLALLAYFSLSARRQKHRLLWLTVISFPLAYLIARILGHLFYSARPFVVGNFVPLIAHAADNGFPSDHTLIAATIAMVVLYFDRRWGIALWIIAALIGASRVLAGVHHIVDIIGAMIIAVAAVIAAHYILYYLRRERSTYISK